jgi:hypothetical protein
MQLRAMESIEKQLRGDGSKPACRASTRDSHHCSVTMASTTRVLAIGPDADGKTKPLR